MIKSRWMVSAAGKVLGGDYEKLSSDRAQKFAIVSLRLGGTRKTIHHRLPLPIR